MPQRFLRPQITNSERWNSVGFQAQSQYIRLITFVDDFGRCDGRSSVVWSQSWAVWNDKHPQENITPQQCEQILQELAANFLIKIYESGGKKVIQLLQWQERIRAGVCEKWPSEEENGELQQNPAKSCKILPTPPSSSSPSSPVPSSSSSGSDGVTKFKPDIALKIKQAVAPLYLRNPDTQWEYQEECLILDLSKRDAALSEALELVAFNKKKPAYFPQSVQALLTGWQHTLDRARKHKIAEKRNENSGVQV